MLITHQVAPRVALFDMGATREFKTFSTWPLSTPLAHLEAGYSDNSMNGLRWLVESCEQFGLRIDELFAWEVKEMKASEFFVGMPAWLQARTHWYNCGFSTTVCLCFVCVRPIANIHTTSRDSQSFTFCVSLNHRAVPVGTEVGSGSNAVTILKERFTLDDFVIIKLDIDNTPIEEAIIAQLLGDPEAAALVCVIA